MMSLVFALVGAYAAQGQGFLEEFSGLKEHVSATNRSNIWIGVGFSPVRVLKNNLGYSVSPFQLHFVKTDWEWEVVNVSYGTSFSGDQMAQSRSFLFRTYPQLRLGERFSVGPVLGYEFVSFPHVKSRLTKLDFNTPEEPFSSKGVIYGVGASQKLVQWEDSVLRLSEFLLKQTYDTQTTFSRWKYAFSDPALSGAIKPMDPGIVFMVEAALLF